MATRTIKKTGAATEVNAEGNEKTDNSTSSAADIAGYKLTDDNVKVRGMAAGYREATRTS